VEILQNTIPEAIVETNTGKYCLSGYYGLKYDTVSLGPGLGTDSETKDFLETFFTENNAQMVIDADAINLIAAHPEWIDKLPKNTILTPHPKEFERLVGAWKDDKEKLERLSHFAQKNQLICVLKGAHTAIALPDGKIWFNSSGNPGMATAGSGDVLTGIIGGLLAKAYTPETAALLGVYAHGRAADLQCQFLSPPFMLASDIIDGLNEVWKEMENSAQK
jgi:NAD(P)H-hydrate epimerase